MKANCCVCGKEIEINDFIAKNIDENKIWCNEHFPRASELIKLAAKQQDKIKEN